VDATATVDTSLVATAAALAVVDANVDTIKAKTDNLPATPAPAGEYTAAIAAVKSVADDILVDTGTTLDTLVKDIPTNAELTTALGTADNAVLAAIATAKSVIDNIHDTDLPAVKAETALIVEDTGTTLPAALTIIDNLIDTEVAAIKAKTDNLPVNTTTTLAAIQADLDNPDQYKANVSGLATTAHMQEVENKVDIIDTVADGIKAKTNQLAFSVPNRVDASATVDTTGIATSEELELIGEKVDNIPIAPTAQQIWTHPVRTLIQPGISLETPIAGSELILYKDATNIISLSNLGDLSNRTQVWFTIKANLDMPDDESILQVTETGNLQFINQINVSDLGPDIPEVTLAVIDEGQATITISAEAGQALPVMQVTPVEWDLKVAFSDGSVIPIQIGTAYIRQTATRAIS